MEDSAQSLASATRRFFSGTMLSRMSGLGREVLMAFFFGTQPAVAAFWMAFRFAHLLRRIFGEGALHAAFVPYFEGLKKQDVAKASRFFYDLSVGVVVSLIFLVILSEGLFGSMWLCGLFSGETKEVMRLTMILFPGIIFISLYALNTSFLNCEGCYFLPSIAPFFFNLAWITAICMLHQLPVSEAMLYLSMVLVFAFMLQWMVTLPRVTRSLSYDSRYKTPKKKLAVILRPFALGLLGVAATQINSGLDAIFAHIADSEGPAYLWYAMRLHQLPLALFGLSVASALLPAISRSIDDKVRSNRLINYAVHQTMELMLPVTAALIVLGLPIINVIYGRGAFTTTGTLQTTACLQAYSIGLLPMALVLVFASPFYARSRYAIPVAVSVSCVGLNVLLNVLFVFVWKMGAVSIAMATTISSTVNALVLYIASQQHIAWKKSVKLLVCSLLAALVTYYYQKDSILPRHFTQQMMQLGTGAAIFATTFVGSLLITRTRYDALGIHTPSEY